MTIPATIKNYWWTKMDQKVAQGEIPPAEADKLEAEQPHHGRLVTPYGLSPQAINKEMRERKKPSCKQFVPGKPYDIPTVNSAWGMPLHLKRELFTNSTDYAWIETPELPSSVQTFEDLRQFLREKSPERYSDLLYGDKEFAATARAMFDYWKSSKYRWAATEHGSFNWKTYNDAPETLLVRVIHGSNFYTLPYVISEVITGTSGPASRGPNNRNTDRLSKRVKKVVDLIVKHTTHLERLLEASARALKHRTEIIAQLTALKAVGEAVGSQLGGADGLKLANMIKSPGPNPGDKGGGVLPLVERALMSQPIHVRHTELKDDISDLLFDDSIVTRDLVKEIKETRAKLHRLLFDPNSSSKLLRRWARANTAQIQTPNTSESKLAGELAEAMAEGIRVYVDCAEPTEDPDWLYSYLLTAPDAPAAKSEDLDEIADSTVDVMFAVVGKTRSLVAKSAALPAKVLQTYAEWKLGYIASQIHWGVRTQSFGKWSPDLDDLLSSIGQDLPDSKLRARLQAVIETGSVEDLPELRKDFVDKAKDKWGLNSPGVKAGNALLSIVSLLLSIRGLCESTDDHEFKGRKDVLVYKFGTSAVSFTLTTIGTAETVMAALGKSGAAHDTLKAIGAKVGLVTSLYSIYTSGVAYWDAANRADGMGMVSSYLGTGAALSSAGIAIAALFGVTAGPIVAALGVAAILFTLSSGAVSLANTSKELSGEGLQAKMVALGLIRSVRSKPIGKYLAKSGTIGERFKEIEQLCLTGDFPRPEANAVTSRALGRAGLGRRERGMVMDGQPAFGEKVWDAVEKNGG